MEEERKGRREKGKKGGLTVLHPRRSGNRSIYHVSSSLGCWCLSSSVYVAIEGEGGSLGGGETDYAFPSAPLKVPPLQSSPHLQPPPVNAFPTNSIWDLGRGVIPSVASIPTRVEI